MVQKFQSETLAQAIEDKDGYRYLWENASDILFVIDPKGNFLELNKTARNLLGYKDDEIEGLNLKKIVDKRHLPEFFRKIEEVIRSKAEVSISELLWRGNGKEILVDVKLRPIIENNEVKAIQGIARDVTKDKKVEEKLREKDRWFRALVENSIDIMMVIDETGAIKYISPSVKRIAGYEPEELIGESVFKFGYPEDIKFVLENLRFLLENPGVPKTIEFRTVHKEGRIVWVEATGQNLLHDPAVKGIVVNFRDITDRKATERIIKESEEKYRMIFEMSPALIAILDENGTFIDANSSAQKSLGENPIGKNIYDILPKEVADKRMKFLNLVLSENRIVTFEDSREGRDFIITGLPITFQGKRYCMAIGNEITETKRMYRILGVVNNINQLIVRETNPKLLLDEACKLLSSLKEYYIVCVWLKNGERFELASFHGNAPPSEKEEPECMKRLGFAEGNRVMMLTPNKKKSVCPNCDEKLYCLLLPMVSDNKTVGFTIIHSPKAFPQEEISLLQTLANDLAFALNKIELDESKKRAFEQIERNIENYAILVDEIRNPLARISGVIEVGLEGKDGELGELREIIYNGIHKAY
ncbi:MAG: PAS domain S-box protein [Archaeoglobus sp.]|nr:PAS domain S-box protein [Archaeoglobus sp.]